MRSLILLSLVISTFVLPLRLAGKGTRAVVSAFALSVAGYTFALRLVVQHL